MKQTFALNISEKIKDKCTNPGDFIIVRLVKWSAYKFRIHCVVVFQ